MKENIGFTFFIFGLLLSVATGAISLYLKEHEISFKTIGQCALVALIIISPVYGLGDTRKEGIEMFYSGYAVSVAYLMFLIIRKRKK